MDVQRNVLDLGDDEVWQICYEQDTCEVFGAFRIPGFRFEGWLAEMVEEGVYVETAHLQAA